MSVDAGYEAYRKAQQEALEELGDEGQAPKRDAIRTARFELHVQGPYNRRVAREILDSFGPFNLSTELRVTDVEGGEDWCVYTWDVEEPSLAGPIARNISVTAASETKHDAYLVWHALTGFPMTYEEGK